MVTIRLLANVADDLKGAVLEVSPDRARRLLHAGYAERVEVETPVPVKRKGKD